MDVVIATPGRLQDLISQGEATLAEVVAAHTHPWTPLGPTPGEPALDAARLGLDSVVACAPGDVDPELRFEEIWSNPPIRVGKKVLHELLLTWLPRLVVGGHAYLVVQRNLGSDSLQKWLAEQLGSSYAIERLTSVKGFRILAIERLDDGGPLPLPASDDVSRSSDA